MTGCKRWATLIAGQAAFGETTTALACPEGTGYRARTRFAKFFNFKPGIERICSKRSPTSNLSDQLHLPTPEVAYHQHHRHKPTQIQQDMVKALSERASKVHSGCGQPGCGQYAQNHLTTRKLGLDQRIINPMLLDEETTSSIRRGEHSPILARRREEN